MAHWVQAESVFLTKQLSKVHESLEKGVQFLEMSSSTRPTTHVTYKPHRSSNKKDGILGIHGLRCNLQDSQKKSMGLFLFSNSEKMGKHKIVVFNTKTQEN